MAESFWKVEYVAPLAEILAGPQQGLTPKEFGIALSKRVKEPMNGAIVYGWLRRISIRQLLLEHFDDEKKRQAIQRELARIPLSGERVSRHEVRPPSHIETLSLRYSGN